MVVDPRLHFTRGRHGFPVEQPDDARIETDFTKHIVKYQRFRFRAGDRPEPVGFGQQQLITLDSRRAHLIRGGEQQFLQFRELKHPRSKGGHSEMRLEVPAAQCLEAKKEGDQACSAAISQGCLARDTCRITHRAAEYRGSCKFHLTFDVNPSRRVHGAGISRNWLQLR